MEAIAIAVRIDEVRTAMKGLLGDSYEEKVEPIRQILRGRMEEWNCSPLAAFIRLSKVFKSDGKDIGEVPLVYAAAADLSEEWNSKPRKDS